MGVHPMKKFWVRRSIIVSIGSETFRFKIFWPWMRVRKFLREELRSPCGGTVSLGHRGQTISRSFSDLRFEQRMSLIDSMIASLLFPGDDE